MSRLYDDELRGDGLRTTQYSLLRILSRFGEVRQRDLGGLTSLDETTLTRDVSTRVMGQFPLILIPTFFVPLLLIFHLILDIENPASISAVAGKLIAMSGLARLRS